MILDSLVHHSTYHTLGPRFARGFAWLTRFSPEMPDGRYDLLANHDLFALVQSYQTAPLGLKQYESHRQYADIQYVCSGTEAIHYAPVDNLIPLADYNAEKDCLLYRDPTWGTPLRLAPGAFAVFFPSDGHKPGCIDETPDSIKKVVLKVRL